MIHQEESQHRRVRPKPRIPFTQKVWVRTPKQQQAAELLAGNISESGIFVQTTRPPEVGSQFSLHFFLPESQTPIEAVAEVVWVKPFEPINIDGVLPGMGAKFVALDQSASQSLRTFIQVKTPSTPSQSIGETAAATVERMRLEKPLALQIKGEVETIYGYSVYLDQETVMFRTDDIPKESMLRRLAQGKSDRAIKGCIAVPVSIEAATNEIDAIETSSAGEAKVSLRFLELRADLLQGLPKLAARTLQQTNPAADRLHVGKAEPQASTSTLKKPQRLRLILTALLAIALGFALGRLLPL